MKALLPAYSRFIGYAVLLISIFAPFILAMYGLITDDNLAFYKEVFKLFIMAGLLMILIAYRKEENEKTELIRIRSMRQAFFLTIAYIVLNMLVRVYKGDTQLVDTSSFVIFMAIQVVCLEFGVKKAAVDKMFKERQRH